MKISKISSVLIIAAIAALTPSLKAGEVIVKRGALDIRRPAASLFSEKATPAKVHTCPACKAELTPAVTQDAKLKTKTVLVESHACKVCSTTIVRTGAQKATGKDVTKHICGGLLAAADTCCSSR
jgi:purine nucleoside phosphorylase